MPVRLSRLPSAIAGASLISLTAALLGPASPAEARPAVEPAACVATDAQASAAARGGFGDKDHRAISAKEQRSIKRATTRVLRAKGTTRAKAATATATVPVYVHVMRDDAGNGDVTDKQITQQIAVLNTTFGGKESSTAANTGFSFTLAGVDRFNNTQWHLSLIHI